MQTSDYGDGNSALSREMLNQKCDSVSVDIWAIEKEYIFPNVSGGQLYCVNKVVSGKINSHGLSYIWNTLTTSSQEIQCKIILF
jgi:hypothetical protein